MNSDELVDGFWKAKSMLSKLTGRHWAHVKGPAAALILTCSRIGWNCICERTAHDDEGRLFDYLLDPPIVIVSAVKASVRRWRFAKIAGSMPSLVPTAPDVRVPTNAATTVMNFAGTVGGLTRRRPDKVTECKEWDKSCRQYLVSAMSNGQWTQARRAAVPQWDINDQRCQLCTAAIGTMQHRYVCSATQPTGGWSHPLTRPPKR